MIGRGAAIGQQQRVCYGCHGAIKVIVGLQSRLSARDGVVCQQKAYHLGSDSMAWG